MNFMQSIIEFERDHNVVLDICRDPHNRCMYKITFQRDRFFRSFRLPAEDLVGEIGEKIMECQIEQFEKEYALSEGGSRPIFEAVIEKDLEILRKLEEEGKKNEIH